MVIDLVLGILGDSMKGMAYIEMCGEIVAVIVPVYRKVRIGKKFKWKLKMVFKPVDRFKNFLIEREKENEGRNNDGNI